MKKTKILIAAAAVAGALQICSATTYAWDGGTEDPNTVQQEILKKDQTTVPAEGIFKKWDPTNPGPGPTPTDPKDWVDVLVPTKILFGQTDASKGKILAPKYKVENKSEKEVKISVSEFKKGQDADKVPNLSLKLTNLTSKKSILLVDPATKPTFPAEVGTATAKGGKLDFTLDGSVGANFNFDQTVEPKFDLVLHFDSII